MAGAARLGRLIPAQSALFVCDIQEKFRPVIHQMPSVIDTARRMVRGANELGVPVVLSEQVPDKLGSTVKELMEHVGPSAPVVSKKLFSMMVPEVEAYLASHSNIKQVLLCGIETHVCVLQTALDLLGKGYEVHLLVDGISSQRPSDRAVGLHRAAQSGAFSVTSEMALFQLMGGAGHPAFRAVSKMVQEPRPQPLMLASGL